MAEFKALKTDKGLGDLNTYLINWSYIDGYTPSQKDLYVFAQVANNIDSSKYPHVARWYDHIASFSLVHRRRFPGEVKGAPLDPASADEEPKTQSKKAEKAEKPQEVKKEAPKAEKPASSPPKAAPAAAAAKPAEPAKKNEAKKEEEKEEEEEGDEEEEGEEADEEEADEEEKAAPAEKPKPAEKPVAAAAPKSAEKSKPAEKPTEKPAEKKPAEKHTEKPTEKPAEKKPAEKPAAKSAAKEAEKADEEAEEEADEEEAGEEEADEEAGEEADEEAGKGEDDEMDLNLSDEDDEETKAIFAKQKDQIDSIRARQQARAGEAKSNLTLDIKPTGTEVDLKELEKLVRAIQLEGLKWLGSDHVDVAYGVKKIRILCQLVDVLINPDTIREEIEKLEDVQSTDIVAFTMA